MQPARYMGADDDGDAGTAPVKVTPPPRRRRSASTPTRLAGSPAPAPKSKNDTEALPREPEAKVLVAPAPAAQGMARPDDNAQAAARPLWGRGGQRHDYTQQLEGTVATQAAGVELAAGLPPLARRTSGSVKAPSPLRSAAHSDELNKLTVATKAGPDRFDAMLAAVTKTQRSVANIESALSMDRASLEGLQERLQQVETAQQSRGGGPALLTGVDTNDDGHINAFAVDTDGDGQVDTILMSSAPTTMAPEEKRPTAKVRFEDGSEIETTRQVTQEADLHLAAILKELKTAQRTEAKRNRANEKSKVRDEFHQFRFILSPDWWGMHAWNIMLAMLVCVSCLAVPLQLAFEKRFDNDSWQAYSYTVDACFILDIICCFRTAFDSDGRRVRDPRLIARRYVTSCWFYLDICAAFPVNPIIQLVLAVSEKQEASEGGFDPSYINYLARVVRILKVLRLIRLLRLLKLAHMVHRLQESGGLSISAPMMRLFQMFAGFLLLWHWVGCVWIFVCLLEEEDGLINESNIWHIGAFERDLSDNPWPDEHKWTFAVYWGMCVTLGIGFDIVPSTQVETIYTLFCSGGGIFMFAFIVGAASEALSELDSLGQEQRQRIKALQHYMHTRGVSHALARRVLAYQRYVTVLSSGDDVENSLEHLPTSLHRQLNISINRKLFINVRFLHSCNAGVTLELAECLQPKIAMPREYLLRQDEPVSALFLLSRGSCLELEREQPSGAESAVDESPSVDESSIKQVHKAVGGVRVVVVEGAAHIAAEAAEAVAKVAADKAGVDISAEEVERAEEVQTRAGQKVLRVLHQFDSFHEEAFLSQEPAPVSVQAVTYCHLMVLTIEAFGKIRKRHPTLDTLLRANFSGLHEHLSGRSSSSCFIRASSSHALANVRSTLHKLQDNAHSLEHKLSDQAHSLQHNLNGSMHTLHDQAQSLPGRGSKVLRPALGRLAVKRTSSTLSRSTSNPKMQEALEVR